MYLYSTYAVNFKQEPTDTSKQPIGNRYLSHVTGYQPIRDQYFLVRSVAAFNITRTQSGIILEYKTPTKNTDRLIKNSNG